MEEPIIRAAKPEDVDGIAEAHMHSIRALGPIGYSQEIVADWGRYRDGSRDLEAMKRKHSLSPLPRN
jgi:hypothetical protein